jgi:hypothetical protein
MRKFLGVVLALLFCVSCATVGAEDSLGLAGSGITEVVQEVPKPCFLEVGDNVVPIIKGTVEGVTIIVYPDVSPVGTVTEIKTWDKDFKDYLIVIAWDNGVVNELWSSGLARYRKKTKLPPEAGVHWTDPVPGTNTLELPN